MAYKQAILLDPQNSSAYSSLVTGYRLTGKDDLAEEQRKLTHSIMENESEYNRPVFESVRGSTIKAIELPALALEKKQVGMNGMRQGSNLDAIREDRRFNQLHGLGDPNSMDH
jgi:hypothetical protein